MPQYLAQAFVKKLDSPAYAKVVPVSGADHSCCWARLWPELFKGWVPWRPGGQVTLH